MQYTLNRQEKGKIEVKVDVPKAGFEESYKQVLDQLGKELKVEGFRPGMVPAEIIEQKVGTNKLLNEAASLLISKHLGEILKKEDLVPLDSPKIAIDKLEHGSPFAFTASFTLKPQIKLGEWRKIMVKMIVAKEVRAEDVEKSIENIYEAWKKSKSKAQSQSEKLASEQQESSLAKASEEEPVGSGKFIYDAKGNKIPLKDKEDVKATAKEGINDDFAKAIGAQSLSHLRVLVKRDLENVVADQVELKFEEEVFEKIRATTEVEVPEVLVSDEQNRILVRLASQLEQQGKTLDDFVKEENTTVEALKAKWREQAEKNVKTSLILDAIGKEEGVKVSQEEVDNAFKGVNQTNLSAEQKADLERYIVFSIFQSKTLALVKKEVSV